MEDEILVKETEYLVFIENPIAGYKTKNWLVFNKNSNILLGRISWFPRWRQYTFWPCMNTVYNRQCLREISDFIIEHKLDRNY